MTLPLLIPSQYSCNSFGVFYNRIQKGVKFLWQMYPLSISKTCNIPVCNPYPNTPVTVDWKSLVEYIWLIFISILKSPNIMKLSLLNDSISTTNSSIKELMEESGGRYNTIHFIELELWLYSHYITYVMKKWQTQR